MNEKNFEYLKDQVKYTGFGEGLESELKAKMQNEEPNFTLSHNVQYGNDTAVATLNFKKSDQSDMYFFNSYILRTILCHLSYFCIKNYKQLYRLNCYCFMIFVFVFK